VRKNRNRTRRTNQSGSWTQEGPTRTGRGHKKDQPERVVDTRRTNQNGSWTQEGPTRTGRGHKKDQPERVVDTRRTNQNGSWTLTILSIFAHPQQVRLGTGFIAIVSADYPPLFVYPPPRSLTNPSWAAGFHFIAPPPPSLGAVAAYRSGPGVMGGGNIYCWRPGRSGLNPLTTSATSCSELAEIFCVIYFKKLHNFCFDFLSRTVKKSKGFCVFYF
jgi:hypothetical protein